MEAHCKGDLPAFDELFHRAAPRVHAVLLSLSRSPVMADDLTQITFLKVHRGRNTWMQGAPVMPWLAAIARRAFFDARGAIRRHRTSLTPEGDPPEAPLGIAPERDALDALSDDEQNQLRVALDALPTAQREVLQMLKIEGLSLKEVARVSGSSAGAVKVRLDRAHHALRQALGVTPPNAPPRSPP